MFDRSRCEPKQVILASLRAIARDLDPSLLSCADAVELVEFGAEVERLGAAIKTVAAGRAAEGDAWRRAGDRNPADWLAKRTGSTVGDARGVLETASSLADAPGTSDALRAGQLSPRQAAAIAPAAAVSPADEDRLLAMASTHALQKLTDECARVRAAADPDPKTRHERIHKERFWRKSRRTDGMAGGTYGGTPEEVARFESNVQAWIDERLDRARRTGESEPSEAYAFDGLMAAAAAAAAALFGRADEPDVPSGDETDEPPDDPASASVPDLRTVRAARGGRGRKRLRERRELFAIVDLTALRRGSLQSGETCEIPGVGTVPLDVAIEVFGEALLRVVIRDGVDVQTVVHAGRLSTTVQETAVFVRQRGRCAVDDCGYGIAEIDHTVDYVASKQTTLSLLFGLCGHHHDLKRQGHTYLPNGDGTITWIRPDGTVIGGRPPPIADTG